MFGLQLPCRSPPTSAMLCCAVWAALRQGAGDGALTQGKHVTKPLAVWYNQFSAALIEEGGWWDEQMFNRSLQFNKENC